MSTMAANKGECRRPALECGAQKYTRIGRARTTFFVLLLGLLLALLRVGRVSFLQLGKLLFDEIRGL